MTNRQRLAQLEAWLAAYRSGAAQPDRRHLAALQFERGRLLNGTKEAA